MMMVIGGPMKADKDEKSYGKSEEMESDEGGSDLSGMARKRAAKAVLEAIESGDVSALDTALAKHRKACE